MKSLVFAGSMVVNLPVFKNLTCLEMTMEIRKLTFEAFMKFLNMCPNLQSLYFSEVDYIQLPYLGCLINEFEFLKLCPFNK